MEPLSLSNRLCKNFLSLNQKFLFYLLLPVKFILKIVISSQILASHLIEPFYFSETIKVLYESGYRNFLECGVGNTLTKLVQKNLKNQNHYAANIWDKENYTKKYNSIVEIFSPQVEVEPCKDMPIAIVGMGCVVPGAHNVDTFWQNLQQGVSGIVDVRFVDPFAASDFLTPNEVKIR